MGVGLLGLFVDGLHGVGQESCEPEALAFFVGEGGAFVEKGVIEDVVCGFHGTLLSVVVGLPIGAGIIARGGAGEC